SPAEAGSFAGHAPFFCERIEVRERREVIPIKAGCARPANELRAFVEIEVMRAKVFADQKLRGVPDSARPTRRRRGRNRGRVQNRKCRPCFALREKSVFKPRARFSSSRVAGLPLIGFVGEPQLKSFDAA